MRSEVLCLVAVAICILGGCALADGLYGVEDRDGDGKPDHYDPNGGVIGQIGALLSGIPGWAGLLGAGLVGSVGVYHVYRKRKKAPVKK